MSARISFTLIGIQGLKRKFALCWLLVWWFPLSFKVLESGCFLRLSKAWMDVVCRMQYCHPPLPPNTSGIFCHTSNTDQEGHLPADPRKEYKSLSFLSGNFESLALFVAVPAAALVSGCCEVILHRILPWWQYHKLSSGNSVGNSEVRCQTECWQGHIWGTSPSLPLSFMKPLETARDQRIFSVATVKAERNFLQSPRTIPHFSITWRNISLFPEEKLLKASNTKCFLW